MSFILDTAMEVFAGAQMELLIFIFAIVAHSVFFGKYSLSDKKVAGKGYRSPGSPTNRHESPPNSPVPLGAPPSGFVKAVQGLINEGAAQEEIARGITEQLQKCTSGNQVDVLAGMLAMIGKSGSVELLAAVRSVLKEQGLQTNPRLSEALLRGYLILRRKEDFDELLAEVEAVHGKAPNLAVLALRASVGWADLEAALRRLPGVAPCWRPSAAATPSAAHGQLLQQLIRLAVEKGALTRLLGELRASGLFAPWVVEALLAECASGGNESGLGEVRELAVSAGVELTPGAHAALIKGAGSAEGAVQAFKQAVSRGPAAKEVLLAAASAAAARGDAALASAVLQKLPATPPGGVAAAALRLCAAGGPLAQHDADGAVLKLYEGSLANVDLADAQAERLVADAALRKKRPDLLSRLLVAMPDGARRVALLKSFATEKRVQDSLRVFEACPEKTACLYNSLLDACIDGRDLATAERVMKEATTVGMADVVTYNTMVKAHLQNSDTRRARATMEAMRAAGLEPNCVTFNELLDATIRERSDSVWAIVDEMRACGLKPNHVTCSIVLKSIQRASTAKDVEKALAVVDCMEDAMDEVLLSSVCEACIRAGRSDLLVRQLERQKSCSSVQVKGAHTYGSIIRAYGFINDIKGVWNTWKEMKTRHIMPTSVTLGCMVEALASNGDPEAGYELIREQMEEPQSRPLVNAVIYCSVLKGFSHRKRFDRVWSVYGEMRAEGLQFSIVTYNTLIDACSRSGEMGRISALLEEMAQQKIEPNIITYSTVIKGYCQENRVDKAFELLEDMKRTKQFCPDEVTYNTLLDGCARYGMWDKGIALLNEMQKAGVPPSNFTLSVLAKLANRSKRPDKAFELTDQLCAKYNIRMNVHVFNNLVHACTAHGNMQKGMEVFQRMLNEKVRPDARTYMLLLRGCISAKAPEAAAGLLRAAGGLRSTHPGLASFSASAMQPKGGLSADIVSEALEGIAGACNDEALAVQLFRDLRHAHGITLDPRVPMRLTSKALHGPQGSRQQYQQY